MAEETTGLSGDSHPKARRASILETTTRTVRRATTVVYDRSKSLYLKQRQKPGFEMHVMNVILFGLGATLCIMASTVISKAGFSYTLAPFAVLGGGLSILSIVGMEGRGNTASLLSYLIIGELVALGMLFFVVPAVFMQDGAEVFIKQWWSDSELEYFRKEYCFPPETYDNKCTVPIGTSDSMKNWCMNGCRFDDDEPTMCETGSSDCSDIRLEAQLLAIDWSKARLMEVGILGFACLTLVALGASEAQRMVTRLVAARFVTPKIAWVLFLASIVTLVMGSLVIVADGQPEYECDKTALGMMMICAWFLLMLSGLLGAWMLKTNTVSSLSGMKVLYSVSMFVLLGMGVIGLLVAEGVESSGRETDELQDLACTMGVHGCLDCDAYPASDVEAGEARCPQWTDDEVLTILKTNIQMTALMSMLLAALQGLALRGTCVLQKALRGKTTFYNGPGKWY